MQDPAAPCTAGNSASYQNIDEALQDIVARLEPHPTQAGLCRWRIITQLAAGLMFRDSNYIGMLSMLGVGSTNHGAGTRLFFKGQAVYDNVLPGAASCSKTVSLLLLCPQQLIRVIIESIGLVFG